MSGLDPMFVPRSMLSRHETETRSFFRERLRVY